MPKQTSNELAPNAVDYRVAVYKGILSNIPILGGLMAEVVGAVIPAQQNDRLRQFVEALEAKIQELNPEEIEARFKDPEFIDLLQESLTQAVRAVAHERIEHITAIVQQSLTDQERRYIHYKKLLYLLKELNDIEVLMLCGYSRMQDRDFWGQHGASIQIAQPTFGASQEIRDSYLVQEAQRAHLVQLKLLKPRFQKPKRGELPDIDEKTGMMKVKGYDIAPLGRLLLRSIREPDGL